MVKVSVIVPVYNVEKYISKCIDSLVNQTLEEIEIILVNDGTKDDSQKIIDEYKEKYPDKIISIIKENEGQGSARNEGLKISSGEYIAYVDSDDYVDTTMFEKMYNKAKEDNSDIVICGNYLVTEQGKVLKSEVFTSDNKLTSISKSREILFDKMAVWNKIYRADFLKNLKVEFRSKKWYEDFDFSVKVLLSSESISIIEQPLYYYLLREGSTMNNSNIDRNLEIIEAMDEIVVFCKDNKIYDEYYLELEYLSIIHIYLAAIVRIINAKADKKLKRENIRNLLNYLEDNFITFKKNKYIKTNLSFKKKVVLTCIKFKLYKLVNIMFKLK